MDERWAHNQIKPEMRGREDGRLFGLNVSEQMQEESPADGCWPWPTNQEGGRGGGKTLALKEEGKSG